MSEIKRPIIECEHIGFRYSGERMLEDISFSVEEGGYVGIVGSNGSGKTTLLKILLGLLRPDEGNVRLFGTSPDAFKEWNMVGYVPQNVFRGEMGFPATVAEVVESGHFDAKCWRCRFGGARCASVDGALEQAGIMMLKSKRIGELSGGERQRVFIARALVSHPRLLVLDEPTTGIDMVSEEKFYDFLETLNKSGITIVLVSHDLEAVAREVKTVLCLNRKMVCYGKPSELRSANVLRELYGGKQMLMHAHNHPHS